MKTARELMRENVSIVNPDTNIKIAVELIFKQRFHAIPVIDKNKYLVGILSDEDIIKRMYPDYLDFFQNVDNANISGLQEQLREYQSFPVKEFMSKTVFSCNPDRSVFKALSKMFILQVNQLPIIDNHKKLLGMIYKNDIYNYMIKKYILKKK